MATMSRKRPLSPTPPAAASALAALSEAPDEMDAAIALSGMLSGAGAAPQGQTAAELTHFAEPNQFFPCTAGKGWFVKTPEGTDVPFLERLFLILSFPKAVLTTRPGLCLSDAIRWKDPEQAELCGAPPGAPCIEIVNVPIFEAEIYPQYASGSFNKTATKWGLISPPAGPDRTGKKLLRECMYMPATVVDGQEVYPLRPLPAGTTPAAVNDYIARHLRRLAHAHRTSPPLVFSRDGFGRDGRPVAPESPSRPVEAADTLDDDQMAQIMSIVKKTTDYQLNDSQLRAILALKDGAAAAAPASAAAPSPPPHSLAQPVSAVQQLQQQVALQATLGAALGVAAAAGAAAAPPAPAPPKRQAAVSSWDELRVTLWDTKLRKRVSGSSYKGDLSSFLARNPHMEVYNRQDEAPKPGQQLMAGQKMQKIEAEGGSDPKVVMWHSLEQRKLSAAESPTQSELYKFLRAHPEIVVYDDQDKGILCASELTVHASADAAAAAPTSDKAPPAKAVPPAAPVHLNFKRLTSLEPAAMNKTLTAPSTPGPTGGILSYSALAQLANGGAAAPAPAASAAAAAAPVAQMQQLAQLQALLTQSAPSADSLTLLQAAQMARMANVNTAQLALASALASRNQPASSNPWKGQVVFK